MMSKNNPAAPRVESHDSRADVLLLKPPGGAVRDHLSLRPGPETLATRVAQFPFFARFAVINLVGVALLAAAWADGLLLRPYRADESGMCYLITVLFLGALVAVSRKDWQTVRWAGNALVYLGMVGTVLGLIITVSDLSVDKAQSFESFKAIVTAIYVGAGTALYTNLLACIGYLWLGTNAHLLARPPARRLRLCGSAGGKPCAPRHHRRTIRSHPWSFVLRLFRHAWAAEIDAPRGVPDEHA